MLPDDVERPVIIGAVGEDELDLVMGSQQLEIIPSHVFRHPAARTFYVHYDCCPRIDVVESDAPVRLEKNRKAAIGQTGHKGGRIRLQQGFAAGYLDQLRRKSNNGVRELLRESRRMWIRPGC